MDHMDLATRSPKKTVKLDHSLTLLWLLHIYYLLVIVESWDEFQWSNKMNGHLFMNPKTVAQGDTPY